MRLLLDAEVDKKPTVANLLNYLQNASDEVLLDVFGGDDRDHAETCRNQVVGELRRIHAVYGDYDFNVDD